MFSIFFVLKVYFETLLWANQVFAVKFFGVTRYLLWNYLQKRVIYLLIASTYLKYGVSRCPRVYRCPRVSPSFPFTFSTFLMLIWCFVSIPFTFSTFLVDVDTVFCVLFFSFFFFV
uniref:Uncharacterized protein n=1 Tax=Cacopsylla melanoneura TaxID=428564 RepID=A0A8D8Z2J7_9HEMI